LAGPPPPPSSSKPPLAPAEIRLPAGHLQPPPRHGRDIRRRYPPLPCSEPAACGSPCSRPPPRHGPHWGRARQRDGRSCPFAASPRPNRCGERESREGVKRFG
jgi:hypothetical protein